MASRHMRRFGWLGIAALIDLVYNVGQLLAMLWMAGNRGFDRLLSLRGLRGLLLWMAGNRGFDRLHVHAGLESNQALDGWESRL